MMGALILLLVVTTRQIRRQAQARELAVEVQPTIVRAERPAGESDEARAAREAARRQRSEEEAESARKLQALEAARDERLAEVAAQREALAAAERDLERARTGLSELKSRGASLQQAQQNDARVQQAFQTEQAELTKDIAQAQYRVAALKRQNAEAQSKFAFVPYDGALGTTRRPIFIECNAAGLRIMPEDELLGAAELQGFTERYNPLLVGAQALSLYWTGQADLKPERPDADSPPYVLLLVRPSGTVTYYLARRLLTHLGQPFGYELIEEDYPIFMPEPDPQAKLVVRRAIQQALQDRQEVMGTLASRAKVIELEPFDGSSVAGKDPVNERWNEDPLQPAPHRPAGQAGGSQAPGAKSLSRRGGGGEGAGGFGLSGSRQAGGTNANGTGLGRVSPANSEAAPADIGLGDGTAGGSGPFREGGDLVSSKVAPKRLLGESGMSSEAPGGPGGNLESLFDPAGGAADPKTGRSAASANPARAAPKSVVSSKPRNADGGRYPEEEPIESRGASQVAQRRNPLLDGVSGSGGSASGDGGSAGAEAGGNGPIGRNSGGADRKNSANREQNAKQRWGHAHGRSTIGLERKLEIQVTAHRVIVGEDDVTVPVGQGESREKLIEQVLAGIDEASRGWGLPPDGFHYIPTVKFKVYPGGNQHYERLNGALKKWGLVSSVQFAVGERPPVGKSE